MNRLMLAVFLLLGISGFSQARYDTLPNLPDHYRERLAKFKAEPVVTGKVLFLGNSITEGGNWRKLLKDSTVINRGISGDNTFGVLQRLDEIATRKPSRLFLLIGVNDLSKDIPTAAVIQNIFNIVSTIHNTSPKTIVCVQSLLPVNPGIKNFMTRFSKQQGILEINAQLRKYAGVLKYTYIDLHHEFSDSQMQLDARFTYDGLHLNAAGYQLWVAFLKKGKYL